MNEAAFLRALATSASFWRETLPFAASAIAGIFLCVWYAARQLASRRSLGRSIMRDDSASAAAVDFVLTFPLAVVVVCATVQFALLANASFVTHYAAYTAARSARINLWDPRPLLSLVRFGFLPTTTLTETNLRLPALYAYNRSRAVTRARNAACLSLAAIAPSAGPASGSAGSVNPRWTQYLDRLAAAPGTSSSAVFKRKVQYSCNSGATRVDISVDGMSAAGAFLARPPVPLDSLPVRSTVTFRFRLALPPGPLFGSRGSDGYYTRSLKAEVAVP